MQRALTDNDERVPLWWEKGSTPLKLEYALQQRFSHKELAFMEDWKDVAITTGKAMRHPTLPQLPQRTSAQHKAWAWAMDNFDFRTVLHDDAPRLHCQPHCSTTKQLDHAVKYAVGVKSYVHGISDATPFELTYGDVTKDGADNKSWAAAHQEEAYQLHNTAACRP